MKYLKHNTLRPWSFRPASLSILRASSKDLVMVDKLAAKNLGAFLTRAPNSKGWCEHAKILLIIKSGEQGAPPLMA